MTNKARRVLLGYSQLSDQEMEWLKRQINNYDRSGIQEKRETKRNLQDSVVLGPLDKGCACCGR